MADQTLDILMLADKQEGELHKLPLIIRSN